MVVRFSRSYSVLSTFIRRADWLTDFLDFAENPLNAHVLLHVPVLLAALILLELLQPLFQLALHLFQKLAFLGLFEQLLVHQPHFTLQVFEVVVHGVLLLLQLGDQVVIDHFVLVEVNVVLPDLLD